MYIHPCIYVTKLTVWDRVNLYSVGLGHWSYMGVTGLEFWLTPIPYNRTKLFFYKYIFMQWTVQRRIILSSRPSVCSLSCKIGEWQRRIRLHYMSLWRAAHCSSAVHFFSCNLIQPWNQWTAAFIAAIDNSWSWTTLSRSFIHRFCTAKYLRTCLRAWAAFQCSICIGVLPAACNADVNTA
jgi:hypothetical protein